MSKDTTTPCVASSSVLDSTQQLVRVFDGMIGGLPTQVCDGRELHAFLKNGKQFADWIKHRVSHYGFEENQDFSIASPKSEAKRGGHNRTDYHLTLDMAKELSMVENNEQGRKARRYFIDCEKRTFGQDNPSEEQHHQLAFESFRIGLMVRGGRPWFGAANIANALRLRGSSDRITRGVAEKEKCYGVRGKQKVVYISYGAAMRAATFADHERADRFRVWIGGVMRDLPLLTGAAPVPAAVAQLPQLSPVERFSLEQLINTRLLVGFNSSGGLEVKAVKPDAMVVSPERLASMISDDFVIGRQHLPEILDAVATRMRHVA
ncbi:hypothetical protein CXF92_18530 [Pseudomonas sp. Choline-3u-10]|uniref:Putative antirepressor protein n=1 Tax=viral metagenome TaxID=1070528 RepID=A0A6H1ZIU2_9ZZZZ|nr:MULTISPECIES: antA/AntB antirepressor family protein [Pseudomonadaceae]PKG90914.1 hypothetical protein CXF92_18530 [Pseudomonas sp. Choline-3u-10]